MTDAQIQQLRSHLGTIHDDFKVLYAPARPRTLRDGDRVQDHRRGCLAIKQARPWVFRLINSRLRSCPPETGLRQVAEGTANGTDIGLPVAAADPEGDDLTYSLGGPDAEVFSLDSGHGPAADSGGLGLRIERRALADVVGP